MFYLEQSVQVSFMDKESDEEMTESIGIYLGFDEEDGKHSIFLGGDENSDRVYAKGTGNIKYISGNKGDGSVYWGGLRKRTLGPLVLDEQIASRCDMYNKELKKTETFMKKRDEK